MYQIQYTWYVVYVHKVLYLVPVLVQAALERTEGNAERRTSSLFSSIICPLLLVAKSNRLGLFEEEGKMTPVFEIEIDILSIKNGEFGGVFNNSSRLSDILPDSRSLIEIEVWHGHLRSIPYHPYKSILLGIYRCDDEHGGDDHDFEMDL